MKKHRILTEDEMLYGTNIDKKTEDYYDTDAVTKDDFEDYSKKFLKNAFEWFKAYIFVALIWLMLLPLFVITFKVLKHFGI